MVKGRRLFVTGTGTGVGKTHVAGALASALAAAGRDVVYWKPVQTGADDDTGWVARQSLGAQDGRARLGAAARLRAAAPGWRFPLAASPDQAAAAAGLPAPTVAGVRMRLDALPAADVLLVEGAGGVLVPLNSAGETWADVLAATGLPALVVASPALGTLNHTGLTLAYLESRGVPVVGVVLSGERHAANEASLRRLHPHVALHALPPVDPDREPAGWREAAAALASFVSERLTALAQAAQPGPWLDAARRHVWFPYTQHQTAPEPLPIARAQGVWLETADGERLLDGTSSWWVNTIGHGRPEVARALARQQQTLDHVLFAGAVHAGAARLAARLAGMAGAGLSRVFFSDNGSTAVEVALKIAYQACANRGEPGRTRFVSFRGSYHGDTFGAMSVAQATGFHGVFGPLLFATLAADPVTEHPSTLCPEGAAALPARLEALARLLAAEAAHIAGVVLEPLLQGAGGMLAQPVEFVRGVAALCRRYGVPLILDEVFTGLGRLGAPFAFQRAGIEPDLVACAKGLTGGNLPLAATLARDEWYAAFLAADRSKALLHGHSYTANPLACAAAQTALDISEAEDLPGRARAHESRYKAWLADEGAALGVLNGRALGGVLAFELPGTGGGDYFHPRAAALPDVARRHGLFLRPLGNTVYLMPPLAIGDGEREAALAALAATVRELG